MGRRLLLAAALLAPSAAHAEWQVATSDHFTVYSNDDPARVKALTTRLETFDRALKVLRQVPERRKGSTARVIVFVVNTIGDVQRLAGRRDVAGFYSARATGAVSFVPRRTSGGEATSINAERVLLHEYGHHFMYSEWPSAIYPMWFSEGFAEFHSTAIFNDDGSITFGAPPLDRGYGVTMANQMPMQQMLRPDPGKMSSQQTYALYSRGWLLTHYLTFEPDRRQQLGNYMQAINDGKSAADAGKVFGDLDSLDHKLTVYVQRPQFRSLAIPASELTIGAVTVRALGPGEAATMPARVESEAGVTEKEAPVVAAMARRLAAPFPGDAAAQNELAEAEYDAKNWAAAEAAADRAMAADPKSVHAVLYKGMALQARAKEAKSSDPAQWQAIRRWYAAANKIDPENPQPLILYYRSFAAADQKATANAESGMLYAAALAPFQLDLRLDAARIYLRQGKVDEARSQLRPVAYSPHVGAAGDKLRGVLAALDAQGAAAALMLLDKRDAKDADGKAAAAKDSDRS